LKTILQENACVVRLTQAPGKTQKYLLPKFMGYFIQGVRKICSLSLFIYHYLLKSVHLLVIYRYPCNFYVSTTSVIFFFQRMKHLFDIFTDVTTGIYQLSVLWIHQKQAIVALHQIVPAM